MIYSFILNPRGRIVSDLFIYNNGKGDYLLEVDSESRENFLKTLKLYRLRRKADLSLDETPVNFSVNQINNGFEDPRVKGFGFRVLGDLEASTSESDYLLRRLEYGIGEGLEEARDQIPLNFNGDITNGISFDKGMFMCENIINNSIFKLYYILGCYVGQELIARTHHTGIIRRRILPFTSETPDAEGFVRTEDGTRCGKVLKSSGNRGIAFIALEKLKETLLVKTKLIKATIPDWWPSHLKENKV